MIYFLIFYLMKTIQEIKQTPLSQRTVEEEYRFAKSERRQAHCVYCQKPLEVTQTQYDYLHWRWDNGGFYKKHDVCDADKPCCNACGMADSDFIDEDLVAY